MKKMDRRVIFVSHPVIPDDYIHSFFPIHWEDQWILYR